MTDSNYPNGRPICSLGPFFLLVARRLVLYSQSVEGRLVPEKNSILFAASSFGSLEFVDLGFHFQHAVLSAKCSMMR